MKTLPLAEVKNNLSRLVDRVESLQEEVTITKNGRPAAVIVSTEEYEGWKETLAIRSDEEFMEDIRKGIKAIRKRSKLYHRVEDITGLKR
jgi:prevent-host-death family protein